MFKLLFGGGNCSEIYSALFSVIFLFAAFVQALMRGQMFQQAYIDIAEVGARCPVCMNLEFLD